MSSETVALGVSDSVSQGEGAAMPSRTRPAYMAKARGERTWTNPAGRGTIWRTENAAKAPIKYFDEARQPTWDETPAVSAVAVKRAATRAPGLM